MTTPKRIIRDCNKEEKLLAEKEKRKPLAIRDFSVHNDTTPVLEETGLTITKIIGEGDTIVDETNGFKVLTFTPFCVTQNLTGNNSFILNTFICNAKGNLLKETNETQDIRWIATDELRKIYINNKDNLFQMHVNIVKKYLCI